MESEAFIKMFLPKNYDVKFYQYDVGSFNDTQLHTANILKHDVYSGEFQDFFLEMQKQYHGYTLLLSCTDFYIMNVLTVNARNKTFAHYMTHNYAIGLYDTSMAVPNPDSHYTEYTVEEKTRNECQVYCHSREGLGSHEALFIPMTEYDVRGHKTLNDTD